MDVIIYYIRDGLDQCIFKNIYVDVIFDPQTITNAFVTLLWEVAVCILVCVERGNGACLLRATIALACLVPWL